MTVKMAIIDKDCEYLYQIKKYIKKKYKDVLLDVYDSINEYKKASKTKTWNMIFINEDIKTKIKNNANVFELLEEKESSSSMFYKYQKTSDFMKKVISLLECVSDNCEDNTELNDEYNKTIVSNEVNDEIEKENCKEINDENRKEIIVEIKEDDYKKMNRETNAGINNYTVVRNLTERVGDNKKEYIADKDVKSIAKEDSRIITIYSPYGGIGKSKNAYKIARTLSHEDKTFYLDLQMFSQLDVEYKEDGINFVTAAYNVFNISNNKFLNYLYERNNNLYMFYPLDNPYELLNFNTKDFINVVNKIVSCGFKYIVIDIDSRIDKTTLEILEQSSLIFLFIDKNKVKIKRLYNLFKSSTNMLDMKSKIVELQLDVSERKNLEKINKTLGAFC